MAIYIATFWGPFFTGVFLPQKSVLSPPIESQYMPFQKHVSFYILKRSPESFVWAAPPLLRGGHYLINEENTLRGANTVRVSNPARVKANKAWHFKYPNTSELY
jgi:hypothetical protein